MKKSDIDKLVRENIRKLQPYSSARDEYSGAEAIFLDANENPNNEPYNRYPDPLQWTVKQKISSIKGVQPEMIFLGNGSDEAIDLLITAFCQPGKDTILSVDPTYGMYKVCADINEVKYKQVLLKDNFQPDVDKLLNEADNSTRLLFLCSPNNPTSNSFNKEDILALLDGFDGLVILDEAYIDFSHQESFANRLKDYENLVILQTFSKAWGLAGIRLGMCFADRRIIAVLNKIKYPYNVNSLTLKVALEALVKKENTSNWVNEILRERDRLAETLPYFPGVLTVYPSDANFLMVKVSEPKKTYEYLVNRKIIVRDRSKVSLCEGCLRISIGSKEENDLLLEAFEKLG